MTPKIKFSHWYNKFNDVLDDHKGAVNTARLLLSLKIHQADLSVVFKVYDTHYGKQFYVLPKSEYYLLLIFVAEYSNKLFPTIRRYTPQKYDYYRKMIGERFEVVLTST